MGIITQTGGTNNHYSKENSPGSRLPSESIAEAASFYEADGTEGRLLDIGSFGPDRISWSQNDFTRLRVIRGSGGEQIPRVPGMAVQSWGVDLTEPPFLKFNPLKPTIGLNECIYVIAPNQKQSIVRPAEEKFQTDFFEVAPAGSQSTFTVSMPIKLTYLNGSFRNKHYALYVDGKLQRLNTNNGLTDGDYQEIQVSGTDKFGSITFNTPVGDALSAINVEIQTFGFYNNDDIALFTVLENGSRLAAIETDFLTKESLVLTPTATSIWHLHSGNSITLSPGTWLVFGHVRWFNNGAPVYSDLALRWSDANGDNTVSVPTGLTGHSMPSGDFVSSFFNTSPSSLTTFNSNMMPVRMVVPVGATKTMFLNTFATLTTPASARILTMSYAQKIAKAQ